MKRRRDIDWGEGIMATVAIILAILLTLIPVALTGLLIYVVYHFVTKFW